MNREIIFRAKRIDNSEFCYGSIILIIDPTKEETVYNNAFMHGGVSISPTIQVNVETVGEFTGLKDKNGKEIYEGDILKYEWQENPIVVHDIRSITRTGINYSEIIGNIYENPELLK